MYWGIIAGMSERQGRHPGKRKTEIRYALSKSFDGTYELILISSGCNMATVYSVLFSLIYRLCADETCLCLNILMQGVIECKLLFKTSTVTLENAPVCNETIK